METCHCFGSSTAQAADPAPAAGVSPPLSATAIPAMAPGEGMTWDASNGLSRPEANV